MSSDNKGLSGIDNLTPFEYALAGVTPPSDQDSPGLSVIEGMRQLAAGVDDAPVTDPRLQEFIRSGGPTRWRNDRRSLKRKRSGDREPAEGGFVDITPVELTNAEGGESAESAHPSEPAGLSHLNQGPGSGIDSYDLDGSEPTSEQPAVSAAAIEAEMADDAGLIDGAGFLIAPGAEEASPAGGPADDLADAHPPVIDNNDEPADTSDQDPAPDRTDSNVSAESNSNGDSDVNAESNSNGDSDVNADSDGSHDEPLAAAAGVAGLGAAAAVGLDHLEEADFAREFDAIQQAMLDPLEADDAVRDESGRFAGSVLFADNTAAEPDVDGTERLLDPDSSGIGPLLPAENDGEPSPVAVAALTGVVPLPERRFGGAFWALAGTATAALLLALGGWLWATSLQGSTDEDSAASSVEAGGDAETEADLEPSASEPSSEEDGGEDASATGALGDDADGNEEDDSGTLAVDGTESDDGLGETDQVTTTAADGNDTETGDGTGTTDGDPEVTEGGDADSSQDGDQTATTGPPSTETTAAPTTEAPPTTLPTTRPTTPPTTAAPVTRPPTTAAPVTDPPPTPVVRQPSTIGDRVTLGSFNGPGVSGVRVLLYEDHKGKGKADQLVGELQTDSGGYYLFEGYAAGCYVITFDQISSEVTMAKEQSRQSFCLSEGGQNSRIDAFAVVKPADGCLVEQEDGKYWRGVEVYEDDGVLADSYTFYDRNGNVVTRTKDLGPPDDLDGPGDFEWFGPVSGFPHRDVYRVATEYNGVESTAISCERQSNDD